MKIYFDVEEDAAELIAALHAEGFATTLQPEGFAGEDDSEDRAWVLTVDPFDERVVAMVDVYGGWLAGDLRLAPPATPDVAELPTGPKRIKRPTTGQ